MNKDPTCEQEPSTVSNFKTAFFVCFFFIFKLHPFLAWKMWTPIPFLFVCESVIWPFHTVHPDFWTPPPAASGFCNSPHPRSCSQLHPRSANTTQTSALGKSGSQILSKVRIQVFGFIAAYSSADLLSQETQAFSLLIFELNSSLDAAFELNKYLKALNYIRLT